MDLVAAELLLRHLFTEAGHDWRPGHEHLRGAAHHDGVVAVRHPGGTETGHRSERQRHDRHGGQVVDRVLPAEQRRDVGAAVGVERLDRTATAGAVDQSHDGDAQLERHLLGVDLLLPDGGVGRAAAHGEVVPADHDGTTVDAAAPHYEVAGGERLELAVLAVAALAGQRADLVEGVRVEQRVDALAHRELAPRVLPLDLLRTAHGVSQGLTPVQLVDVVLPAVPHGAQHRCGWRPATRLQARRLVRRSRACGPRVARLEPVSICLAVVC